MLDGIDVSNNNGPIDMHKVKYSGKYFIGVKATEGLYFHDPLFRENWTNARHVQLKRIAYHFNHPGQDGAQQAEYFHQYVHAMGKLGYGDAVMLDIETLGSELPGNVVKECEAFIDHILHTTIAGIYIYTSYSFWHYTLNNPKSPILAKCPLWQAAWGLPPQTIDNWPKGPSIWQSSGNGHCPGVIGDCDIDHFMGTRQAFQILSLYGGRR